MIWSCYHHSIFITSDGKSRQPLTFFLLDDLTDRSLSLSLLLSLTMMTGSSNWKHQSRRWYHLSQTRGCVFETELFHPLIWWTSRLCSYIHTQILWRYIIRVRWKAVEPSSILVSIGKLLIADKPFFLSFQLLGLGFKQQAVWDTDWGWTSYQRMGWRWDWDTKIIFSGVFLTRSCLL